MKKYLEGLSEATLLDTSIAKVDMPCVISMCQQCIESNESMLIGVINAAKIVNKRMDPELKKSLDETDFIVADGLPVVWLSKLAGDPLPERVAGIDIMMNLLKLAGEKEYGVFFLGAKEQVVQKVAEIAKEENPGMRVAGVRDGYFNEQQEQEVADEIRNSKAHILFVAMGSPKKENFLRRYREHMQVGICHGVGGSFDVVAGVTKRAPMWMQNTGLEWLYRVAQEPGRMWKRYLVTNTRFMTLGLIEVIKHRLGLIQKNKENL